MWSRPLTNNLKTEKKNTLNKYENGVPIGLKFLITSTAL